MRYLGGKSKLLEHIDRMVADKAPHAGDLTDVFAGSNTVARWFRSRGLTVTTNDVLACSYVLARGTIGLPAAPTFTAWDVDPFALLTEAMRRGEDGDAGFVARTYSPMSVPSRMYVTERNARRIDAARQQAGV